jgi:Domain of unknown function (DUF929)
MSTSKKERTERARVVAEMREAEARAERRRRLRMAGAVVGTVAVVAAILVVIGLTGSHKPSGGTGSSSASSTVEQKVTSVPADALDKVGRGSATGSVSGISAPALTSHGKPRVLYVGAEYCPYCAAQRWPMVVALARFGTWSDLGETTSAARDVFPNTATLSFHGASYRSRYLTFTGVETTTNKATADGYQPLDTLSAADQKVVDTYNKPPYVSGQGGSIPFVDLGGRYVTSGASYSPQLLAGKTHEQIAAALGDPSNTVAKAVDGAANAYTAALCKLTGGKPAAVCTSSGVTSAAGQVTGP